MRSARAPSLADLQRRFFDSVEVPTRTWLLVPEGQDGVLGHVFASLAARAGLYSSDASDAGLDALNAACAALRGGDLKTAVAKLADAKKARSPTKEAPPDDWLDAATDRLKADQAAKIIKAKVALVQVAPAGVN